MHFVPFIFFFRTLNYRFYYTLDFNIKFCKNYTQKVII